MEMSMPRWLHPSQKFAVSKILSFYLTLAAVRLRLLESRVVGGAGLVLAEKRQRSTLKNAPARRKQGADAGLKRPLCGKGRPRGARGYTRLKALFMAAEALVQAWLSDSARRVALKGSGWMGPS